MNPRQANNSCPVKQKTETPKLPHAILRGAALVLGAIDQTRLIDVMMAGAIKKSIGLGRNLRGIPRIVRAISMRVPVYASAALTWAALALPLAGVAQKFQEPTKEELQMTADPKAPGAAAVFLYREEAANNRSHYISSYARIKVLTEKGKEWATVEVPYIAGYSAPPIIEGRTIHPDGTVIPLIGKAENLLVFKSYRNHVKAAVFNLPSVEVGSILEYKWTIPLTGGAVVSSDTDEGLVGSELASTFRSGMCSRRFTSTRSTSTSIHFRISNPTSLATRSIIMWMESGPAICCTRSICLLVFR